MEIIWGSLPPNWNTWGLWVTFTQVTWPEPGAQRRLPSWLCPQALLPWARAPVSLSVIGREIHRQVFWVQFYSHHSQEGYSTVGSTIGPQLKAGYTGPAATPGYLPRGKPDLLSPSPHSQWSKDFGRLKPKYYGFSLTAHCHLGRNLCLSVNGSIFLYPSPEPFHPPDYEFPNQEVRFFTFRVLEIAVRCVTQGWNKVIVTRGFANPFSQMPLHKVQSWATFPCQELMHCLSAAARGDHKEPGCSKSVISPLLRPLGAGFCVFGVCFFTVLR